uniref:Uncharacterized protein n=1 Tax=Chromera velia CCMP2878 TaxID=1169474 RepID=A0A0G4HU66_9ALVE|eukprot:Cvel_31760.t1-p1 / transcript=Cvel_31760.t1 / gene=Cvel_31760 / organism=Chromera_velia_CCMP2878 / gene_product=POC1 centriolar protein homolog B, putative / transcript_product=POC1 centriolar protein homolog B, putative / location=Cvel_scaffold4791:2675-6299(-) / protein_length=351 / sequence_SO=supercontig / SO=protein_coding / is_pseudo=false
MGSACGAGSQSGAVHDPSKVKTPGAAGDQALRVLRMETPISSLHWDETGSRVGFTDGHKEAKVWLTDEGDTRGAVDHFKVGGHSAPVTVLVFSPNGKFLLSAGRDGMIIIWLLDTGEKGGEMDVPKLSLSATEGTREIRALAFAGEGKLLLSSSWDSFIRLWDPSKSLLLKEVQKDLPQVVSMQIDLKGRSLLVCNTKGDIQVWDVKSFDTLLEVQHGAPSSPEASEGEPDGSSCSPAIFSPTGASIISGGGPEAQTAVRVWEAANAQLRFSIQVNSAPRSLGVSPQGRFVAAGLENGEVAVCDLESKSVLKTLKGHTGPVLSVGFRTDGRILATGGADGTVQLWQTGGKL